MNKLLTLKSKIVERKIRYDSTIVDHTCLLLEKQLQSIVLFHEVQYSFTMTAHRASLTIPKEVAPLHTIGKIVRTIYTYGEIRMERI